jgi:tetratricopeptide (TPR) repeat protein
MTQVARSNAIYYLHPSFGYYFEQFYSQPVGLLYELKFYPTNALNAPLPTPAQFRENEDFWKAAESKAVEPVAALASQPEESQGSSFTRRLMELAHLKQETNAQASTVAAYYSHALNYYGVQLQKSGRLDEAMHYFTRAQELNPDNIVAKLNLEYNGTLRAGKGAPFKLSKSVEDQFGKYRNWGQVISLNGPFDEPSFCYELGRVFAKGELYRQAAQQFDRVKTLAPGNLAARLWLAQLYNLWQMPDQVLAAVAEIRAQPNLLPLTATNQVELVYLEASAQFARTNNQIAEGILEAAKARYPEDQRLLSAAVQIYLTYKRYSNALATVEEQLRLAPDDLAALGNKGYLCLQLNAFADAIPPLSRVLAVQTNNYSAMFNRAIACLQSGNFDAAQSDYQTLHKVFPAACQVYYGLGEIAYRKKDTNAAIIYYQLYRSNSIPSSEESKLVSARLVELQARSR